jgi:hypothetical protein
MKPFQLYASALLISSAMLVSACSSSSKTEEPPAPEAAPAAAPAAAPVATSSSSATAGQKLIDLNKAREAGAITDEEYEAAKKKLLDAQ